MKASSTTEHAANWLRARGFHVGLSRQAGRHTLFELETDVDAIGRECLRAARLLRDAGCELPEDDDTTGVRVSASVCGNTERGAIRVALDQQALAAMEAANVA